MARSIAGFNAERTDPLTGCQLLGNGYRTYSPVLCRFMSRDDWSPFGAGGLNAYAYCAGDPVKGSDPSGHMSWQAGLGIGLCVVGGLGSIFSAGASLAAAGSIDIGLAAATAVSLVADVSAVASATLEDERPRTSTLLGWVSLATGVLSFGIGMGPGLARLTLKLNMQLGQGLQKSLSFLNKIERRGNLLGVPLSGEFRNPRFLGRFYVDDQMHWSFSFEDNIPLGRRLNVVMGKIISGAFVQARADLMVDNEWVGRMFTPAALRDFVMGRNEAFQVYRFVIPDSSTTMVRGRQSLSSRIISTLGDDALVVGFKGNPRWRGRVADYLQAMFTLTGELDRAGFGHVWAGEAQRAIDALALQYGNIPGSLTFDGEIVTYPVIQRGRIDNANFE